MSSSPPTSRATAATWPGGRTMGKHGSSTSSSATITRLTKIRTITGYWPRPSFGLRTARLELYRQPQTLRGARAKRKVQNDADRLGKYWLVSAWIGRVAKICQGEQR